MAYLTKVRGRDNRSKSGPFKYVKGKWYYDFNAYYRALRKLAKICAFVVGELLDRTVAIKKAKGEFYSLHY